MPLLGLLEMVLIIGILFSIVYVVVQNVPIVEPWKSVAFLVLALIAVVMIFSWLAGGSFTFPHLTFPQRG